MHTPYHPIPRRFTSFIFAALVPLGLITGVIMAGIAPAQAAVAGPVVRELSEQLLRASGREVTDRSLHTMSGRIQQCITQHGEGSIPMIRAFGDDGIRALNQAGQHSGEVIRLHARMGRDALHIIHHPDRLALFLRHGDGAAQAMVRHPGTASPLIRQHGNEASAALNALSRPQGQRLGQFANNGGLDNPATRSGLLRTMSEYGDEAMNFIWRHKGALAVTAVAVAFIADPEPFINGVRDLAEIGAHAAVRMLPGWMLGLALALLVFLFFGPWIIRRCRQVVGKIRKQTTPIAEPPPQHSGKRMNPGGDD